MNIEEILDLLDELLDRSWNLPLSGGRCVVDAEKVRDLLDDVRLNMPTEIKQAKAIVAPTTSGSTARRMAKYRPQAPILAITTSEKVLRQLCLAYGVIPLCQPHLLHSTDDMIDSAISLALEKNLLQKGDITVITAGYPTGSPGTTNLIKVRPV